MKVVKYAVKKESKTDAIIIVEDGGIATIHHNGFHLLTTYYQDRPDKFTFDDLMWDKLAEGKESLNDWEDKQIIDKEVIQDAIEWLYLATENFEFKKVPFHKLVDQYNNPKDKKTKRELIQEQIELINKMRKYARINLVNCGSCGSVLLHKTKEIDITCPYCEFKSEPCDFPDFLYDGMLNNICE